MQMEKVLITGGTGLIGTELASLLIKKHYNVSFLSRKRNLSGEIKTYRWDLNTGEIDKEAIKNTDYIIHLAGANVASKNWSKHRKKEILESRTKSGELLFKTVKELNPNLKAFISASGVGYYGSQTTENIYHEEDNCGNDFLANVCQAWEVEALKFKALGFRTVILRTGVVLSEKGGALKKMKTPVKWFLGSALGTGKQYMPWIHISDLTQIYLNAIENSNLSGTYNAAAKEHQTNRSFTKTLCKSMKRPFIPIPVPTFVLKLIFGEMSSVVLEGSRIDSSKIRKTDCKFEFPTLKEALDNLSL